jgi:hypothetical protein
MSSTTSDRIPLNEQRRRPANPFPPVVEVPVSGQCGRMPARSGQRNRVFWAGLLILIGIALLAGRLEMWPRVGDADSWDWIMLGIGGLLVLSGFARVTSGGYEQPSTGRIIIGLVLTGIGVSAIFGISSTLLWPAALIVLGFYLFLRNLFYA